VRDARVSVGMGEGSLGRCFRRRGVAVAGYSGVPGTGGGGSSLTPDVREAFDRLTRENGVVVFMKGTAEFPQCGFSNTVVQILNAHGCPFEHINVLESDVIRQAVKEYSQWPTIPQVYIGGEFVGGADIMIELYQSGELAEMLEIAQNS